MRGLTCVFEVATTSLRSRMENRPKFRALSLAYISEVDYEPN